MKGLSKLYTALIFIFLYAPLIVMIVFSFNSENSWAVFGDFSFRWYKELFRDEATLKALKNTLILAAVSSVISTILGTVAAVGISKMKKGFLRRSVMTVTNMPMMNPDIVTGVSMMLSFVFIGVLVNKKILGFPTILIAHITFQLPYVILSVLPQIKQMDRHLPEAARDLGCTPLQSFFKVELRSILPGIFTGLMMAFTLSMDDFVISYFVSGDSYQTLPIRIFTMVKRKVTPDICALSTLIFVAILILLLLINMPTKEERAEKKRARQRRLKNKKIKAKKA